MDFVGLADVMVDIRRLVFISRDVVDECPTSSEVNSDTTGGRMTGGVVDGAWSRRREGESSQDRLASVSRVPSSSKVDALVQCSSW